MLNGRIFRKKLGQFICTDETDAIYYANIESLFDGTFKKAHGKLAGYVKKSLVKMRHRKLI